MRVRVRDRSSFSPDELDGLRAWLEAAYDDGPWREEHWDEIGPDPHVVAEDDDGSLLAHACGAWVPVTTGPMTLRAGYLEDVATRPDVRGRGYGTAVVVATHPLIPAGAVVVRHVPSPRGGSGDRVPRHRVAAVLRASRVDDVAWSVERGGGGRQPD